MIDLRMGDCLDVMAGLAAASVDAVVTDPPAGIAFMGKSWDRTPGRDAFVDFLGKRLAQARRMAKPGSYALVWAIPRTSHWTALAIEDAGWVIRDRIAHLFGSGFPKAKSCLKPACEDWWLAWNPADRMTPLQIDACRIPAPEGLTTGGNNKGSSPCPMKRAAGSTEDRVRSQEHPGGRWPANVVHDGSEEVLSLMPTSKDGVAVERNKHGKSRGGYGGGWKAGGEDVTYGGAGSAARFFYCAKASRSDRDEGLDGIEEQACGNMQDDSYQWKKDGKGNAINLQTKRRNHHPTVKPTELMRWLCRLITPPGGIILDPFMGSGSTGKAAVIEGFGFIGIERDDSYFQIAQTRIQAELDRIALLR